MKENVVFLASQVYNSDDFSIASSARNARVTFVRNPQMKILTVLKDKKNRHSEMIKLCGKLSNYKIINN